MQPPNDQRNFVHKRIVGAVGGFLTGGPTGAIAGAFRGRGRRSGGQPTAPFKVRPPGRREQRCPAGFARQADRSCAAIGSKQPGFKGLAARALPFGKTGRVGAQDVPAGDAVMGQYGAALEPFVEDRMVRTCLPGMILGKDGLCYNRRDLRNNERAYPRGTRPLGTPGEMAALRKAASFGRRMETTIKRMQKIGVVKKPSRGRRPYAAPAPRQLAPGTTIVQN